MMRLGYAVALLAPLMHSSVTSAAEANALDRVRACVTQTDDTQRLACYDAALGVVSQTGTAGEVSVVNPSAPQTPPAPQTAPAPRLPSPTADDRTAIDRFGYYGEIARDKVDREEAAAPKLKMLQARITAIDKQPLGEFVLTLDNGQVWRQKAKESIGPLHVGDQVTIRAGALGSFRLSGSSNRSTLVQRVK